MAEDRRGEVTLLLQNVEAGDEDARARLFEVVYQELHELAERLMRRERVEHTLQPTALVNEAVLRLQNDVVLEQGHNRAYFFGTMAQAMRRILVDHARKRAAQRRGGERERVPMDIALESLEQSHGIELLALDDAMDELKQLSPRQSEIVQLRFFGGLGMPEIAEHLQVSLSTVEKDWRMARAWLHQRLSEPGT